jgi:signal-transduction protein with cAMP-binding, CBS, and nucleotidyltransferase domain
MDEIGEYMSSPVLSVDTESSVQEAAQYMAANHVGSLLIKDYNGFVGIVTDTDLTRRVVGRGLNPENTKVSEIMTYPVLSIDRFLPMDQASETMRAHRIRHLAVSENDKIVGILSVKDLVTYYAQSFRVEQE